MRKTVEAAFETRTGGTPLVSWILQQRADGAELEDIALRLSHLVGISVRPASLRRWVMEG